MAVTRPELQRIINECEAVGTESARCIVSVCSFREWPVVFCTMRDPDSCNRAILTVFQFQCAVNNLFDLHGRIMVSVGVRSRSFETVYLVRLQLGPGMSLPPTFPSIPTHHASGWPSPCSPLSSRSMSFVRCIGASGERHTELRDLASRAR